MGKITTRVASYLSALQESEYKVNPSVGGIVNYVLDSFFSKSDERMLAASQHQVHHPHDLNAHIREMWLGCESHKTFTLNDQYPAYWRAQTAWAFSRMLNNFIGEGGLYEIIPFLDSYEYKEYLKDNFQYRAQSAQLEIAYSKYESLPVFGVVFLQRVSDGKRLILNLDLCFDMMSCSFTVATNPVDQSVAEQFFIDLSHSMSINDIYRNQCLSYDRGKLGFQVIRPTTWDDVIISQDLKDRIQKNSSGLIRNMEVLNSIGFPSKRNSLLISPPGMAKTTMFRAVSDDLEGIATRIWCTGKSIEYPEHVSALFESARKLAPCVILIEDMDLFGGERTSSRGSSHVLNEFLAQLDGTGSNNDIIVLASTNDFQSMDESLLSRPGRFNDKIMIPLPNAVERGMMLLKFFKTYNARKGPTVTDDIWKNIIELTDGFTGDYIREVVDTAVLYAADAGRCVGRTVQIEGDDLVKAGTRTMENYGIGQQAKKHIIEVTKSV